MTRVEDLFAESGLAPDQDLARLLSGLADLPDQTLPPAPSADLVRLFAGVQAALVQTSRAARVARATAGAATAALLAVGGSGLAAAANTLPTPLQHRFADFSERYLPFRFPEPGPGRDPGPASLPHLDHEHADSHPAPGDREEEGDDAGSRSSDRDGASRSGGSRPAPVRSTAEVTTQSTATPRSPGAAPSPTDQGAAGRPVQHEPVGSQQGATPRTKVADEQSGPAVLRAGDQGEDDGGDAVSSQDAVPPVGSSGGAGQDRGRSHEAGHRPDRSVEPAQPPRPQRPEESVAALERAAERAVDKAVDKAVEKADDKTGEKADDRTAGRSADRTAGTPLDRDEASD